MTDPYDVLGVPRGASPGELRRAYLDAARRHHPDRGGDPAAMRAVNEAWAAVSGDPADAPDVDVGVGVDVDVDIEDLDLDLDLLDDRPLAPPPRAWSGLAPVGLFAACVAVACIALALDLPAALGFAAFLFFLSCVGVAASAMLALRRSLRADRRR